MEITVESLVQGSPEWHALRSKMVGASDAPIIMQLAPPRWKTPLGLWEVKKGLTVQEETWSMSQGKEMEPEARRAYEKEVGEIMFPSVEISQEYPWAMASLDGMNLERTRMVEIKCPGKEAHDRALKGEIPEYYQCQMQFQMMVTGLAEADYWSYRNGSGFLVNLKRNDEFIAKMIIECQQFYQYLVEDTPPPLTERDFVDLSQSTEGVVWALQADEYFNLRKERMRLEKLEKEAQQRLIAQSEGMSTKCAAFKFTKSYRKGAIDYSAIPELDQIDLEEYRNPRSVSWLISKEKEE